MILRAIIAVLVVSGAGVVSAERVELSREDIGRRFELASAAVIANSQKIRTWEGAYLLTDRQLVASVPIGVDQVLTGPFFQECRVSVTFELDLDANFLRTEYRVVEPPKLTKLDGTPIEDSPDFVPPHFRSIATPEHFLYLQPDTILGEITGVELPATLKRGRTIQRTGADEARKKRTYSFAVDPRTFFMFANGSGLTYGQLFTLMADSVNDEDFQVRAFTETDGLEEYFVVQSRTTGAMDLTTTEKFSLANSYLPSSCEQTITGGHVVERRGATFRDLSGAYVPETYTLDKFDIQTGELRLQRRFEWVSGRINDPLDDAVFALDGLQVREGDRYVDEIENRVLAVDKQHNLVGLEEFSSAKKEEQRANARRPLVVTTIVLMIVTIAVVYFASRSRGLPNSTVNE